MINTPSPALGTSLLLARLGQVATTPPTEQEIIERLYAAANAVGCRSRDLVTAFYVGLKLRMRICMCGPARDRTVALFDALVTTLIGAESGQMLHVHGPIGDDEVSQRFAALRLGDFVSTSLEPVEGGNVWVVLVDTPGEPTATVRWVEQEIAATLRANGRSGRGLPANLFVLVAAGEPLQHAEQCWLTLPTPRWDNATLAIHSQPVPPVGYQRYVLEHQLTGSRYRQRMKLYDAWLRRTAPLKQTHLSPRLVTRWLAASIDERHQGLWVEADFAANARAALTVLEACERERDIGSGRNEGGGEDSINGSAAGEVDS